MDNKIVGGVLIAFGLVLAVVIFAFTNQLASSAEASCSCTTTGAGVCPHEESSDWQTYLGLLLLGGILGLGIYLIFFEKSQKAIISTLEKQKKTHSEEERFQILLKGLSADEKKVLKAVKEQDGISQSTLRLRTDLHKSKLSILLDQLEKKDIIKKVKKGKTNQVFLKIKI